MSATMSRSSPTTGGCSPAPSEKADRKGQIFAATPASDFICGTLQLATGVNLHVFTSGCKTWAEYWKLHDTLALTAEGLPLGLLDQRFIERRQLYRIDATDRKRIRHCNEAIDVKESRRWVDVIRHCHTLDFGPCRTVHICDREGDIYELFRDAQALGEHVLIPAACNRAKKPGRLGLMWLARQRGHNAKASCETFLDRTEWISLSRKINRTRTAPKAASSVDQVFIWIAKVGGYIARTSDPDTGTVNLWRGWERLSEMVDDYRDSCRSS